MGNACTPTHNAKSDQRLDIHFGRGTIPACLAETIIISLENCPERRTLGESSRIENIEFFVRKAEELGFTVVDRVFTEAEVPSPAPPTPAVVPAAVSPAIAGEEI